MIFLEIKCMITVLRLGHRRFRDMRITTHVALTARAFGANKVILSGEKDDKILESVADVAKRWGGGLEITYDKNWKKIIKDFKGTKVHLTMFAPNMTEKIKEIKAKKDNLLLIVGGEKVPVEVFQIVDYNIAIGNQPHSEVAATAIFLHEYTNGQEFNAKFKDAKIKVDPMKRGRKTVEK